MMIYINNTTFVLILQLENSHSMIETSPLKNVAAFFHTIIRFLLLRNDID